VYGAAFGIDVALAEPLSGSAETLARQDYS
jgi:hypothetical protein